MIFRFGHMRKNDSEAVVMVMNIEGKRGERKSD